METRSKVDLRKRGLYNYAAHESTDILCIAFKVDNQKTRLWIPNKFLHIASEMMDEDLISDLEVTAMVHESTIMEAHNAGFEKTMWHYVMYKKYGFPDIDDKKLRCSAAKAATYALPRSLDKACRALNLPQAKHEAGYKIMMKMCKPRKPSIYDLREWHEDPTEFKTLCVYCKQDVDIEHDLSSHLYDMSKDEYENWYLDLHINERGIPIDVEGAERLCEVLAEKERLLLDEVREVTGGYLNSPKQVSKAKDWFSENGLEMEDLTKNSVENALKIRDLSGPVKRMLEIRRELSLSSVAKLQRMINMACSDGRVRGTLLYHGASTGRFSGKGIQIQNFPRQTYDSKQIDEILKMPIPELEMFYDNVFPTVSKCLRGMIKAPEGRAFIVCDFSSIEARVLAWVAGETKALKAFKDGKDLYKVAAEGIYNTKYDKVTKDQRQIGKTAVLALGYQGWVNAFKSMALNYGISFPEEERGMLSEIWKLDTMNEYRSKFDKEVKKLKREGKKENLREKLKRECERKIEKGPSDDELFDIWARPIIMAWRETNPNITKFWRSIEHAAKETVKCKGKQQFSVADNKIKFGIRNNFLHCRLPNGRLLSYYDPKLIEAETPYGAKREVVSFYGVDSTSQAYTRNKTYGGKLTENVVQAIARDLLCEAIKRLEAKGYYVIGHVHDEVIIEISNKVDLDKALKDVEKIMTEVPKWAKGMPIGAEGYYSERYKK